MFAERGVFLAERPTWLCGASGFYFGRVAVAVRCNLPRSRSLGGVRGSLGQAGHGLALADGDPARPRNRLLGP